MATSGDSDDKILLFNNNGPPESYRSFFEKIRSQKTYKEKIWLSSNVKYSTENDNPQVWSDRKLLFWFAKDKHWVEIK